MQKFILSKYTILTLVLLTIFPIPYLIGQQVPSEGLRSITPEEMKAHVYYLASDAMKGRNTPSPELDSCAAYIAREFASYGLKSVGSEKSFFQRFNVLKTRLSSPNTLTLIIAGKDTSYQIKNDFVPLHLTANKKVTGPLVFAGYGITAPEYNYDDYRNIDATGKIVLAFVNEPQEKDSTSRFDGVKETDHSKLFIKVQNAKDHGAVGLLLVSTPTHRFRRPPNPWPNLMRNAPEDAIPLTLEEASENQLVAMRIGKDLADDLLKGTGYSYEQIHRSIDETLEPFSFDIPDKLISMETALEAEKFPTQNVVGFLEGTDPLLKNEIVIIGAHYDHVGVSNDNIYNGADDNASGTAGVLEVAEAFAHSKAKPRRSILFITFAGEEKGLFGSRYFTIDPIFPIENIVAMLNLDMISRNDSNEVAIVGSKSSDELRAINEQCNQSIGLKLDYDQDRYFMQSDHYSFYRKDIPVLFYFTKETPDLHKPSDDPEKIIPEKMARIGQLVFSTAWTVANRDERPKFVRFR
ncbi:MAG: M20/M25/M40 family metallo-hydrolase [candidate division KSB1 bacterium]|nr:M20/M25/M40 family metallo-hydrolase [candidate division KSB1 bacterium]MDZ7335531.1 M20/M25/M40 family metallo-hydrolase [candidate division KSB1 bacterium]MDZ7375609.1 M20/M25/M40 family metallo-hydrolase [candidate division KSB1 bacterium]